MNNKRVTFYFISFLILSLFAVYVWAAGADTTQGLYQVTINNITSNGVLLGRLNVTTGYNINLTCTAERSNNGTGYATQVAAVISNLSLYHNFNSTYIGLNFSNTTNATQNFRELGINSTLTGLSALIKVLNGTALSYDVNGALTASDGLPAGNYTIACAGATNATGTFNYSTNITLAIDRDRPNFTLLNVTDGTNTVSLDLLNATKWGTTKAFLRNSSDVVLRLAVTEPYVDKARIFFMTNKSAVMPFNLPQNQLVNPDNLTLNAVTVPSNSNNNTIFNGSLRFVNGDGMGGAGDFTNITTQFAEGNTFNFWIIANDSAGNIRNFSNGGAGFNFTLDGSAPVITFSIDKTRIESLQPVKATCAANDTSPIVYSITLTKPSGATVVKTPDDGKATFTSLETGEAGKYTISCEVTDSVNYKSTLSSDLTVFYGGEAETSLTTEEETTPVAEVDLSKRTTDAPVEGKFAGIQGESKSFTLDGSTQHTLTFLNVGLQEATIRFESTPVDVTLKVGETKEVDLDGDGKMDVIATLNSITDEKADVTLKPFIQPAITPTETPSETPTTTEQSTQGISKTGIIVLIIVILAVIVVAYFVLKKGKGKKGEIRFTSKDLTSEFNF